MLNKTKRPKPIQSISSTDLILGLGTLSILFGSLFLAYNTYSELPDIIPTHFTINGTPDKFGNKSSLWLLPFISMVLCVGLWILSRFPQYFNYLTDITEENAQRQYFLASKLVRVLAFVVSLIFLFATYETILAAHNKNGINGSWHFFFTIVGFLVVLIIYLFKSSKKG